ncbi:MAG: rane protein [Fibrobacteres bacterium]|nr:rane protein [Fibrobacterota bacterium]
MKMYIALAALGALAFGPVAAQTQLKGRVLEKANRDPVPNALVAIAGSQQSTLTNAKGEFVFSSTAVRPGGNPVSPDRPLIRGRYLSLPVSWAGRAFKLEVFNSKGSRLKSLLIRPMDAGSRLDLMPEMAALSHRFLRISLGGASFRFRLPPAGGAEVADGATFEAGGGEAVATAGALAKTAANITVDFSAPLLANKSITVRSDTGDVGDIVLEYPPRRLDTGSTPIYGAVRLFDGKADSAAARAQMDSNWIMWVGPSRKARGLGATPVVWKILRDPEVPGRWTFSECCGVPPGGPEWGYDDLVTKQKFNDYQLHVEFNLMGTPGDEDPSGNCNSGVYQENRYELQIETIPTPWDPNNTHGSGSIINEFAPPRNLSRPQGKWQAYDITFRNDRYVAGKRTEFARTTIYWNGVLIHNNRKIAGAIACCDGGNVPMDSTVQGMKLQNEKGADVRFRNIWMKPLNIKDTLTNFGY